MGQRINYGKIEPDAKGGLADIEKYVANSELEKSIYELVKLRASQINGCAYCIDMHTKDAREAGETEQRLYSVSVFREVPYYSDREKAALEWTEALTMISVTNVHDSLLESV